jgi:RimJ/RimL family protein N-acetyltransferase
MSPTPSNTPRTPIVTGEKIYLARHFLEDAAIGAPFFSNLELTTLLRGYGITFSLEDEKQVFERITKNLEGELHFAILNPLHELVGGVSLFQIDHRKQTATLGVVIYDSPNWSKGYGSEAVKLMVQYGMIHLNLYNIMLTVFSFNPRAIRAYTKVGFREIGRRRGCIPLGLERHDEVFMDITRAEVNMDIGVNVDLLAIKNQTKG